MNSKSSQLRASLSSTKRIVIKIGTRVLVNEHGNPDRVRIENLVSQMARLQAEGREITLVTSGAIGAGMEALGLATKPTVLAELQMAAAVGQCRLMSIYEQFFLASGICVGQVLLTYDDFKNTTRNYNAKMTMLALLKRRVVPIINENDVVAVEEIKVGDNDVLAAFVTQLIDAELLVLLSTTDGLMDTSGENSVKIPYVPAVTARELGFVGIKESELSTGGMASKLQAAQLAVSSGALAVIADGREKDAILRVVAGEEVGTLIGVAGKGGDNGPIQSNEVRQ